MKRKQYRIRLTGLLLVVVTVLSLIPMGCLTVPVSAAAPSYVALGDSVSTGHGLASPSAEAFTGLVANEYGYALTNLAEEGNTAVKVLDQLQSDSVRAAIAGADLVTITLGGNDLMDVVYQAAADQYNASQTDPAQKITAADVPLIVEDTDDFRRLSLMLTTRSLLDPASSSYIVTSPAFINAIDAFCKNLGNIAGTIFSLNGDVTVIVSTQYNPYLEYNGVSYLDLVDLSPLYLGMEDGVKKLNEQIIRTSASAGFIVADVKSACDKAYTGQNDLFNADPSTLDWDFHPNAAGHEVIAEVFGVYAVPAPKVYTVSFNSNGGLGQMSSVETGESYVLPISGFTPPKGHYFAGWSVTADGSPITESSVAVSDHMTLYAVWAPAMLIGVVTISGTMQVGSTLTATVNFTNNTGTLSYQWYRQAGGNTPISGATGSTYTLTSEDVGAGLYCEVSSSVQNGTLPSKVTAGVQEQTFADGQIQVQDYNGVYDGLSHSITASIPEGTTILYSTDGVNFVPENPAYTGAGTYTVHYIVSKTGYEAVTGMAQVAIEKKEVTVTADKLVIRYSDPEPALTCQVSGVIDGESLAGALTRDAGTNAGVYAIRQGTLNNQMNPNYEITYVGADLTIQKLDPAYTAPGAMEAVFGQTLAELVLPGGFVWQSAGGTPVGTVGTNYFKAVFTPADTINYNVITVDVPVTVRKAIYSILTESDTREGTTEGAGYYEDGEQVTLKAEPNDGMRFAYWLDVQVDLGDTPSAADLRKAIVSYNWEYTFTASNSMKLKAVFAPADEFAVIPMLIAGTDSKNLLDAKKINAKYDFGTLVPGAEAVELPGNTIEQSVTIKDKVYKFAGIIVYGENGETGEKTAELKEKMTVGAMPVYGSAEYWSWVEPFADGVYAAYVEQKPEASDSDEESRTPATGDQSNMFLWMALLVIGAAGIGAVILIGNKKKK